MRRKTLTRILCAVLCAAMLLGVSAVSVGAAPVPSTTAPAATTAAPAQPASSPSAFRSAFDWFFRTFGFILDPYQFTIINQKPVFQWALGFNELYDLFPWVVNVWADTIKCEFNYGGKDWRIQLWKGGYGVFLATGGEIGIYTKAPDSAVDHYSASASQDDWLFLEYTIYNRGKKLFTRPSPYLTGDEGPYWWAPGYKILSICSDFMASPRANVVMDATIQFKDAAMAQKFLGSLEKKGFTSLAKGDLGLDTPEKYKLLGDKKSVQLIWQNVNEGWY